MHNKIRINSPSTAFSSENLSKNAASVICKIFSPKAISSRIGTFVVNTQKFKALCLQSSDYIFKQILNYILSAKFWHTVSSMNIPHFFVITYKIFAFTCYVDVSQNLAVCSTNHKSTSIHSILHTHKYLSKLGFRSRPYISKCFYEKMPLVSYLLFQAVSMNRYFVDHILHIFYVCHY